MKNITVRYAGSIMLALLILAASAACGQAQAAPEVTATPEPPVLLATVRALIAPTATPEAPALLETVRALIVSTATIVPTATPEVSGVLATVRAEVPATVAASIPSTATPEAPSIMATIGVLLATHTPTPVPTPTLGPTPTARAHENSTLTIPRSTTQAVTVKLALGDRIEGSYRWEGGRLASASIQDPIGKTIRDFGPTQFSNFQVTAEAAGQYSLVFRTFPNEGDTTEQRSQTAVTYWFDVYGR